MFLIVVVGSHLVVGKELFMHLLICKVVELCSLLADHSTRIAGIGVGSTAPCCLLAYVSRAKLTRGCIFNLPH